MQPWLNNCFDDSYKSLDHVACVDVDIRSFYVVSDLSEVWKMADGEDIQPLVCDNGTGMVKVSGIHMFVL